MKSLWVVLVVASTFMAGCGQKGSESTETILPPPDEEGPGARLTGSIHDDSGLPIALADVGLQDPSTRKLERSTRTDEAGAFDLGKSPIGTWRLTVNALGYESYTKSVTIVDGEDQQLDEIQLVALEYQAPYYHVMPDRFNMGFGIAYQINGDFNQGCIEPGVTCNAFVDAPDLLFEVNDTEDLPLEAIVFELVWVPNSAACAKAAAVDIYSPENREGPELANPHYWTNYPSDQWSTQSPVVMTIPRSELGNPNAIDDPARIEKNGGDAIDPEGSWNVRNFPPGKGLTNLPIDFNCYMDQQMDAYFTAFYGMSPPAGFSAREAQ